MLSECRTENPELERLSESDPSFKIGHLLPNTKQVVTFCVFTWLIVKIKGKRKLFKRVHWFFHPAILISTIDLLVYYSSNLSIYYATYLYSNAFIFNFIHIFFHLYIHPFKFLIHSRPSLLLFWSIYLSFHSSYSPTFLSTYISFSLIYQITYLYIQFTFQCIYISLLSHHLDFHF